MRFVRLREVLQTTGLSRTTIWRMARIGMFPRPYRISPGAVGWDSTDIEAWIQATTTTSSNVHPDFVTLAGVPSSCSLNRGNKGVYTRAAIRAAELPISGGKCDDTQVRGKTSL